MFLIHVTFPFFFVFNCHCVQQSLCSTIIVFNSHCVQQQWLCSPVLLGGPPRAPHHQPDHALAAACGDGAMSSGGATA